MAPIRKGDGTPLEIPGVQEVRTGDGRVFFEGGDAIPDGDVYLQDDWGDNKLTDRDDSGTTTYNGVEGVYRPEWSTVPDLTSPSVSNERLEVQTSEGVFTDINLTLDETITWEWTDVDMTDAGTNAFDFFPLTCYAQTTDVGEFNGLAESYGIAARRGSSLRLRKWDSSGDQSTVISSDLDGSGVMDFTVTREPDGTWEFFVDGESQGTETDTDWTSPEYIAFTANDNGGEQVFVNEVKVF